MNILVLSREFPPYVLGGISYHLKYLYEKVAEQGHRVTVLAGKCPQSWTDLEGEIHENIETIPVEFGYRKGYYVLYPLALKLRLKTFDTSDFDIAISHTPLPFQIEGLNIVTKYHDCVTETRQYIREGLSDFEKLGDSILHPLRKLFDQRSLDNSDLLIFNSNLTMNVWEDNYSVEERRNVIYNGVDVDKFEPANTSKDYVLFVGSSTRKGLDRVVKYADKHHFEVRIVGDVDLDHDNIYSYGRVSQSRLPEIYSRAVATIHPTYFEAFGNVILESLACGTPVVTTDCCGASEIINDQCGIITDEIKNGVEYVKDLSPHDCRETAKEYTWEEVAKETISVLGQV